MLLSSFLKNSLVDKHGTLLPKTMRHLNSIHLQMFHNNFENYSKWSGSALNRIRTIDRNKGHKLSAWSDFPREKISMGNTRSTFLLMESSKNPFSVRSNAFHTTAVSSIFTNTVHRVSVNGEIGNGINSKPRVDECEDEFNHHGPPRQADESMEIHSLYRKNGGSKGRRHAESQVQVPQLDSKKDDSEDVSILEIDVFNYEKMAKLFPNPKVTLNSVYSIVNAELTDTNYMPKASYKHINSNKKSPYWQCTYKVQWPDALSFSGKDKNKVAAGNSAALKCLHHLLVNRKLKNGVPIIYDKKIIQDVLRIPVAINIKPDMINRVNKLLNWYNKDIVHLLSNPKTESNKTNEREIDLIDSREDIYEDGLSPIDDLMLPSDRLIDPLRGTPLTQQHSATLNKRDMAMYHNLKERQFSGQNDLPIMDYRADIIKYLENDRVLVIQGEPGCGKSTQVPQFILDHFTAKGKGTDCNIIVTQPRKISAISLASRVAHERNEKLGESIGYQVRLQSIPPNGPSGGVLFCSTGILVRRLQSNPNLIGCSHVILDEAHERDLNTDVLIVLLNRALKTNPDLKLVIMSATINAGLFERYFQCNTISVPGFTYPVKMHFLEDIMELGIRGINQQDMTLPNPFINSEEIARLVQWISQNKPKGAILCFLPGWSEIQKLKKILTQILPSKSHVILPVHSRLPHSDQALIFNQAPEGVRKIILATNIAETSITINDVVYVVDSCAHKEVRLQHSTGISSIDNQWVSQGNISQRKGRAGRVQPGESYHFVTKEKYQSLDEYPTPEIMRAELHKAVLDCKTYTSEKAVEFFAEMPEPPKISAVELAVNELIEIGALNENEDLTALGKRIALFPIDPRLSKVMVYSSIFQCVKPIVTLTSILSSEFEIFTDRLYDKSSIRRLKQDFDPVSDHLALAWIFEQWNSYNQENYRHARQFCMEAQLQYGKMAILKELTNLYAQHLSQCRMLNKYEKWEDTKSHVNKYANHDALVRAVLLSGLDRILLKQDRKIKNGRLKRVKNVMLMQDGRGAMLTPDTVNYNREKWSSPYLTYLKHVHSTERRTTLIRETSLICPLTVLLFCQGEIEIREYQKGDVETQDILLTFKGKRNVKLLCDPESAKTLVQLRDSMQNVVRYFIETQGLGHFDVNIVQIRSFKEQMIGLLSQMLDEGSKSIALAEYSSSDHRN